MPNCVKLWLLHPPVHYVYFSLYNSTCLIGSCYGISQSGTLCVLQFVKCNMLSAVILWALHPPLHREHFSLCNVTCLVVSCYGPYTLHYNVSTSVCIMYHA